MKIWVLNPPFLKKFSRPQRSPAVTKSGTIYFPLWLAYCVGILEEQGYDVTFTDAPARGDTIEEILAQGQQLRPDLIVMDTSTPSIEHDIQVTEQLKQLLPDTFILLVGTHVSALAEETLLQSAFIDAAARREYESTVRELASWLAAHKRRHADRNDLRQIKGLSFRKDDQIIHNPDRPYIEHLDELPWVSRVYKEHLHIEDYFNPNALYPMVTLITSRGCPFQCSFCVYPQTFTGRAYRFRSIKDVINEIHFVIREFPEAKSIFFEDDTLTANKTRCLEFAEALIAQKITFPWTANSRVNLDLETMLKIKEAGCRQLCVGFESGDPEVLKTMRKGITLDRMFQFTQDARTAGILIHGCFMLGFPGETRESIDKTIELALELNPDTVQFYPVMVYPGTEAYQEYQQKGWLTAAHYHDWLTPEGLHNCVVRNETLRSDELVRLCDEARKRFYLRPRYMGYKLKQMIQAPSEIVRTTKAARTFFKHLFRGSRI